MKAIYKKAVVSELERTRSHKTSLLKKEDMKHLPGIVKKYLDYTGCVGKEKIINFRSEFKGGIRFGPDEDFMPLKSVQYNFMDQHSRLFYIVAKKKGIPALGLHHYQHANAIFKIKVLGLFTVVDAKGPKMDQAETVTVLNDMFLMAPGSLIDERIQWEVMDPLTVKAVFTNDSISISAIISFDDQGKLLNFISDDRFETNGKDYTSCPWETPVEEYSEFEGRRIASRAKLIYKRPEGDFCYGEFNLTSLEYNCRLYK